MKQEERPTMLPFGVQFDLIDGTMESPDRVVVRRASAMRGHYADADALEDLIRDGDPVHYRVYEKAIPEALGHLLVCVSVLEPGTVGREYFMTKGHYHTVADTAEVYLALQGAGIMLMKTAEGSCHWESMVRGRMVYVPPFWAHRSVNVGRRPLVSFCVYPGHAGHNYGDIESQGFPKRVLDSAGRVEIV
ncbi:MAG: glucose-6-phosphate isomerase family protein [Candidatus Bipolaricaulota bacterium]